MADRLAQIYGTEKDKVNCSFYNKIGACRHGDKCARHHIKPSYSQTIICRNMYQNPENEPNNHLTPEEMKQHFLAFYEDLFCECALFGKVEEMVVCENNNDHLAGNVYVRFKYEEDAAKACEKFNNRWYDKRPIYCELSPVTDFSEACCRQHETKDCKRGGFCNFIHAKRPPREFLRELQLEQLRSLKDKGKTDDLNDSDSESDSEFRSRRRR
ncbi:uncharacterized protein SAPINGB_P000926 [Magnusiomyces paraingens]|uniref:Splicing factor U2AF 23 kDa subunit n=1 Tax=Magnusiomyces paraingens TaxID=2606893 RepID=A0A5E8B9A9_9ASCO|nr:uncharacterized protein SAPINGB_P000926 [Saprochaete ingens]VVT45858.1 unnamed protein product [Saprochaete ingens]